MKKTLTIIALACCVSGVYAQDLTSKKGEQILPEEGDYSIGISADPFLEYMGNFFGKTANNNAPQFNFLNSNNIITGKMFTTPQAAYRASLRIGLGSVTNRSQVTDRSFVPAATNTYPNTNPVKENEWRRSRTDIGLAVGMEKRKGKTRLQGFYGAELGINFSSSRDRFTYGNSLSVSGTPTVTVDSDDDFTGANNVVNSVPGLPGLQSDARITDRKNGATFTFGLRAFAGVEYFVLPKISIGGEFGWGLGLSTGGKTTTIYESIGNVGGTAPDQVGTTTVENPGSGTFSIDTDNNNSLFGPSASLRLNFHF